MFPHCLRNKTSAINDDNDDDDSKQQQEDDTAAFKAYRETGSLSEEELEALVIYIYIEVSVVIVD